MLEWPRRGSLNGGSVTRFCALGIRLRVTQDLAQDRFLASLAMNDLSHPYREMRANSGKLVGRGPAYLA
jgi:hypothetical protein